MGRYASIEEAWGGTNGSNFLNIPLKNRPQKQPPQKKVQTQLQNPNIYRCDNCLQAVQNNLAFNERQKQVATGLQPFPTGAPMPQNYVYAPQYPWHPQAKQGFMLYGPQVSNMFYNNPYLYYPEISNQLYNYQNQHQKRVEHFSNEKDNCKCKVYLFYIIVALILLAIVMCIFMMKM